jgi:beta-galactosidase
MTVRVYTRAEEVRVQLNGREVGRKTITADDKLTAELMVPYEPGELIAIAYANGAQVARKSLATVGAPAQVRLRLEPGPVGHTRDDLAYVYAEVLDAQGRPVPDAMTPLAFHVSGPAELAGCCSANPRGIESLRDPLCRAFHGMALAIVRPLGRVGVAALTVVAPGLKGDRIRIRLG